MPERSLDGEANGVPGGDYRINFYVANTLAAGSRTLVNTFTTGNQTTPAIAADANGDYVVTWSSVGQDGSGYGIYAQRYRSTGIAQGTAFQVNSFTSQNQLDPSVAMDAAGDFVIAWESALEDGSDYGVYAQRYNSSGSAVGSEFLVNTFTTGAQEAPSVAMDSTGDFVIAWQRLPRRGRWQQRSRHLSLSGTTAWPESHKERNFRPIRMRPAFKMHRRRSEWMWQVTFKSSLGRAWMRMEVDTASMPSVTIFSVRPRAGEFLVNT